MATATSSSTNENPVCGRQKVIEIAGLESRTKPTAKHEEDSNPEREQGRRSGLRNQNRTKVSG
jgi:hypothetical protein